MSLWLQYFLIDDFPYLIVHNVYKGVSRKHVFDEKNRLNPLCKYLGVTLKESKRIFDFDNF